MPALYPYQAAGRDFLAGRSAAYLADDPGLGKTAQIITAADAIGAERILVLCPASLKVNWAREFVKFSVQHRPVICPTPKCAIPDKGPLVCIVNYDIVIRPSLHKQLMEGRWTVLACDEAHALKSPSSKRTKAVWGPGGLHRAAAYCWPMSGTPAPNHVGELYATLTALCPQAVGGLKYSAWLRKYCHVIDTVYGEKVTGHKPAIAELKAVLADFMVRRRRAEVLKDLPPLRIGQLTVENEHALAAVKLAGAEDSIGLSALLGSEEAAEEALEDLDEMALSTLRRLCGEAKAHALVPVLTEELDSGTDKLVLMCWHRRTMDILQEGFAAYGVARIDGSTRDRQAQVDAFQIGKCRVFVGQIQAAGTGHTLTAAQDMVIVEPSWTPGDNVQAMLRIHRIGQNGSCLVRFAALAGSLDEAIMAVCERKASLLSELM